ncbi:glycine hydroxymethyltransferase [Paenibacillus sp. CF384]|nr:hypothetical protein [Paenibacillus sp. CF384]SDX13191.1 glycine hydroxymethyltransferase [Paenibacillus sp. CF384]
MHIIAAKAVCFGKAINPSFKAYAAMLLNNAWTLQESQETDNSSQLPYNGKDVELE